MIIIRLLKLLVVLTVELFLIAYLSAGPLDYQTILSLEFSVIEEYFGDEGIKAFAVLGRWRGEHVSLFSLLDYLGWANYFMVVVVRFLSTFLALYKQYICLFAMMIVIAAFYKKRCITLHIPTLMTKLLISNLYEFSVIVLTVLSVQRYGSSVLYIALFLGMFFILQALRFSLSSGAVRL